MQFPRTGMSIMHSGEVVATSRNRPSCSTTRALNTYEGDGKLVGGLLFRAGEEQPLPSSLGVREGYGGFLQRFKQICPKISPTKAIVRFSRCGAIPRWMENSCGGSVICNRRIVQ